MTDGASPLIRLATAVGRWFALLVLLGAIVGLLIPGPAATLAPWVPLLLGVIMFGMGLTLRGRDFALILKRPYAVIVGLIAQFVIMPLTAWVIGTLLGLAPELMVGMVLVGAAPGGTASNVIVYLAKGDVALSVTMTSVSTLLSPLFTPLLVLWLAGSALPVDAGGLLLSIVQVVLVPVVAGLLLRTFAGRVVERVLPFLPLVSVTGIVLVVAAVVGANAAAVLSSGLLLVLAVVLHNSAGLALGWFAARFAGFDESARRAVSVEVGMQNSGLAASLATVHFTPLAALPAALFSVWHNISGAVIATYWARRGTPRGPVDTPAAGQDGALDPAPDADVDTPGDGDGGAAEQR
ncbi:BASS family bile acid:Na+ symporter [Actinoalloteichus hoggarensis]|uniref:Sodium Bile acid symporter family protein n=1 Tax=Actinoalloteichus hoggarensis TaxID=1470176 RepID=A0A221W2W4_9PSEU|nr:bile acid:sodium symporter family protein [Actinoalloteichus hoggarensis]ASO20138.1 Sodium Bile acid symporter family protein [Actinoalloteichus hoggarensis]MBB5919149.1 BASS family bile acid:Na+ symporter [Actinoalloteichus hoggarensis]